MSIGVGVVLLGGRHIAGGEALVDEVERLAGQLDDGGSGIGLTLVFFVPGTIAPDPSWEGVRTGSFDRVNQCLNIQIALPRGHESHGDLHRFVAQALGDALEAAATYFARRNIEWDKAAHSVALARIGEALTAASCGDARREPFE